MENRRQFFKLYVVLLISTAFIFSLSQFSYVTFGKSESLDGKYPAGTKIGTLDISGKTEAEVFNLLKNTYTEWQRNTKVQLQYQEKTAPIDLAQFNLDAAQTLKSIKDGQDSPVFVTIDNAAVQQQLELLFPQLNSKDFNLDKLSKTLSDTASRLTGGSYNFNLYQDFMLANHKPEEMVLSNSDVTLKEIPADLQSFLNNNQSVEIPADSTFSLLDFAAKEQLTSTYSLNVLASGIYQSVLPSNFLVIERNISNILPDYASLGYEAWVDREKKADLIISNPNPVPYLIEFHLTNYHLFVSLKGERFLYTYKSFTKDEQEISPKTIIQYSPLLLPGNVKVQTTGKKGHAVKVYRETYDGDQLLKSELVSEDYYPPVYQIELQGMAGPPQGNSAVSGTQGGAAGNAQTTTPAGSTNQTTIAHEAAANPVQQNAQEGSAIGTSQPANTAASSNSTQLSLASSSNSPQTGKIIDSDDVPGKSDDLPK